jgi:choline kinase
MQVIILAAGLGSRLGELTKETPKPLIAVCSRALIDHSLTFARRAGAQRRVVVGGYHYRDLADAVAHLDPGVRMVENTRFRRGNIISMLCGHAQLEDGDGFLVMNSDHIYPEAIAEIVARTARTARDITAFCDFDRALGADDMKVELDDQRRLVAASKTLPRWDAGYVGMTWIPVNRRLAYTAATAATRLAHGDDVHVESILNQLVQMRMPPQIADVSGHGWYEVDEPAERDWAEARLAATATR